MSAAASTGQGCGGKGAGAKNTPGSTHDSSTPVVESDALVVMLAELQVVAVSLAELRTRLAVVVVVVVISTEVSLQSGWVG